LLAPGLVLDDDEIAARLDLNRVHVNQVCNMLSRKGQIVRGMGPRGKLVNRVAPSAQEAPGPFPAPTLPSSPGPAARGGLLTEDEVKRAVQEHLEREG
jgi:hypothetical protein